MSLRNYLLKSDKVYQEIGCTFRPEDKQQLYNQLQEIGYTQYHHFVAHNIQDILRYISQPPSRRSAKKYTAHPQALLFRFAAYHIARITAQFLCSIEDCADIVDRGSYSSFLSTVAGELAPLVVGEPLCQLPLDFLLPKNHCQSP